MDLEPLFRLVESAYNDSKLTMTDRHPPSKAYTERYNAYLSEAKTQFPEDTFLKSLNEIPQRDEDHPTYMREVSLKLGELFTYLGTLRRFSPA